MNDKLMFCLCRYSRKEGYFADIPKDRGLPKKLCFKFGPKAHGWHKHSL